MNRIRTIIVDDEKNGREVLAKLLQKKHPEIDLVGEASNVEEAWQLCLKEKPQLVFLDIQMPQANGFNLLRKFDEVPFEVVFVTSFDQYAITAIKFNALDYILKPIDTNELNLAVEKVIRNLTTKNNQQAQIVNLIQHVSPGEEERNFAVHTGEKVKMIQGNEVVAIKGDGRYCHLILRSNETLIMSKNLKDFEEYFGDHSYFIRISKSYIINAKYIKEYTKGEPFIITMKNGDSHEVSRRKKPEVLAKLKSL